MQSCSHATLEGDFRMGTSHHFRREITLNAALAMTKRRIGVAGIGIRAIERMVNHAQGIARDTGIERDSLQGKQGRIVMRHTAVVDNGASRAVTGAARSSAIAAVIDIITVIDTVISTVFYAVFCNIVAMTKYLPSMFETHLTAQAGTQAMAPRT